MIQPLLSPDSRQSIDSAAMPAAGKKFSVLIHQPLSMQRHCLAERDLERLRSHRHQVILPRGDTPCALMEQWEEHAATADAVMTGWDSPPITDAMMDAAPNVRVIIHAAGSIKPFIPQSIWQRGVRIASCNDALGVGVAETTLGMIIAGLKGFFPSSTVTRGGGWQRELMALPTFRVRELYDVTIGIIGASRVGRHLIRLLKGFEVRTLLADPHVDEEEARMLGATLVPLDELMAGSDVVSLHAPALESTRGMIGARQFALMKDGAIFVNTARGMIIDEPALVRELLTGRLWAFLDVTSPEPPAADHPFRTLPNVILTPHISGALTNGCQRMGRSAVEQVLEFARGELMHGEITADRLAQLA